MDNKVVDSDVIGTKKGLILVRLKGSNPRVRENEDKHQ